MKTAEILGLFIALRLKCHFCKWTGNWGEDFEARLLARPKGKSGFIDIYIHEEPSEMHVDIFNVKAHNLIDAPPATQSEAEIREIIVSLLHKNSTKLVIIRIGEDI